MADFGLMEVGGIPNNNNNIPNPFGGSLLDSAKLASQADVKDVNNTLAGIVDYAKNVNNYIEKTSIELEEIGVFSDITAHHLERIVSLNESIRDIVADGFRQIIPADSQGFNQSITANIVLDTDKIDMETLTQLNLASENGEALERYSATVVKTVNSIAGLANLIPSYNSVISAISQQEIANSAEIIKSSMAVSVGIASVGLATAVTMSLLTVEDIGKFALFGATFAATARLIGDNGASVLKASLGIATLGLAIYGINQILTPEMIATTAIGLGAIGMALWAFDKIASPKNLLMTSAGLATFGLSIYGISLALNEFSEIEWESIGKAGVVLGGLALGMAAIGNPAVAPLMVTGALALGAISGSVLLFAGSLHAIASIPELGQQHVDTMILGAEGIAHALMTIGNPLQLPFILAGAANAALMAGGTIGLAAAIKIVSMLPNVDTSKFDAFEYSVNSLKSTISELGGLLITPQLIAGSAAGLTMSAGVLALSGGIAVLDKINVPDESKFDSFQYAVNSLSETFQEIGGVIVTPTIIAGAASALALSGATVATAAAIRVATAISGDPADVLNAISYLKTFIDGTTDIFTANTSEDYDLVTQGISAFSGVTSLVSGIAFSVAEIANLNFQETEIVNGKLVVKSSRKLTEDDFLMVGNKIGMIISSLTNPLANIGAQGGIFGNDVEDGINALSNIGSVFTPLSQLITSINDIGDVGSLNMDITSIINNLNNALSTDTEVNEDLIEGMEDATTVLERITALTNDDKLTVGVTNLNGMGAALGTIKDNLNGFELDKLSKMADLMFHVSNVEEQEQFEMLTAAILELINSLNNVNTQQDVNVINETSTPNTNEQQQTNQQQNADAQTVDSTQLITTNNNLIAVLKRLLKTNSNGFDDLTDAIESLANS